MYEKESHLFNKVSFFLALEGNMLKTTINQVFKHVDEEVTIGAWIANKRSSGKIAFLQLRDRTGFIQGVVVKSRGGRGNL